MTGFDHSSMSPEMVTLISEGVATSNPDSWLARRNRGEWLGWELGTFKIGPKKKIKEEERSYVCWHDKDGNQLDVKFTGMPSVDIISPVGPVKRAYVTMADVLRYEKPSQGQVIQNIEFDIEDERFPIWNRFKKEMDELVSEERMVFHVDHIDYQLDENTRDVFARKGRKHSIERLLDVLSNKHDRSHHHCQWNRAKKKIFKKSEDASAMLVTPKSEEVLSRLDHNETEFDESGKIRAYLEAGTDKQGKYKGGDPLELDLLPIFLPDGVTRVEPHELTKLHSDSMFAFFTLTIFGIFLRDDGQHNVMCKNSETCLCTNGIPYVPAKKPVPKFDVSAFMTSSTSLKRKHSEPKSVVNIDAIRRDAQSHMADANPVQP